MKEMSGAIPLFIATDPSPPDQTRPKLSPLSNIQHCQLLI
jgi:hypothetical protein